MKEDDMWFRLVAAALLLVLPACVAPQPAPTLDLRYAPNVPALAKNNITIAVLEPSYRATQQPNAAVEETEMETEIGPADTIPYKYNTDYVPRLQNSLQADLEKLFIAKGFIVSKASGSFVDKSTSDGQKADLVVAASFDLGPLVTNNQKIIRYPTGTVRVVNEGVVELKGSLTIELVEPASKQKLVTKKIDVASLNANTPMEYEDQKEAEEKFLVLLNKVYSRMMAKLEKSIKADELQAAINTTRRLKEKNQPAPAANKPL
jgi:hypothetical protein